MCTLNELLKTVVDMDCSDLHLSVGTPPRVRKNGLLIPLEEEKLSPDSIKNILKEHLNSDRIDNLNKGIEVDFSISLSGLSRFRVNFFMQRGNIVAAFRRLPYHIPNIDSLGLPESVINLCKAKKGLILITGATGSGKSTTMAALIQKISNESKHHIITIEDPIEYLYEHSESMVNQREVGIDTSTFATGLRSALRQDPDVVAIGELRDVESMSAALTIAETGHLVLGTLHTNTAIGTITRLVDAFPPVKQEIIRTNLSMSLLAIISQQLIPNNNKGRSLAAEILINTPAIKSLIRENNIHQIDSYIQSGIKDGMIRMDNSILNLYNENIISKEQALNHAINPSEISQKLNTPNI
tara:strand:+ start:213 stop:1277 length:1065 start_codon:yes stop_codon:yes gene_type:complete